MEKKIIVIFINFSEIFPGLIKTLKMLVKNINVMYVYVTMINKMIFIILFIYLFGVYQNKYDVTVKRLLV